MLAVKQEDLSSIPRIHMADRENLFFTDWPLTSICNPIPTSTLNKLLKNKKQKANQGGNRPLKAWGFPTGAHLQNSAG